MEPPITSVLDPRWQAAVAATHLISREGLTAQEYAISLFWDERRYRIGLRRNRDFIRNIKNIDDLRMAFRILRKMEWEPSHGEYISLLEGVFEDVPGVTLATPQEKKQFWAENASLRQLNYPQLKLALQSRWDYEAKRLGSRYQRFFMDSLQEPIVARACQPSRVETILERFGWEGFDSTFG